MYIFIYAMEISVPFYSENKDTIYSENKCTNVQWKYVYHFIET